jgi:hypothetical protein
MDSNHKKNGQLLASLQNLTTQPLTIGSVQVAGPEFVGYKDARTMFGLSKTHLYNLGKDGLVRTVSIRGRGATRGRRLYCVQSIRALLNGASIN